MDDLGKISLALLALMASSVFVQSSRLLLTPFLNFIVFRMLAFMHGLYKEDVRNGMVSLGSQ